METKLHNLYRAAKEADDAWTAELVATYGHRSGDARYDSRGEATPKLAELKRTFHEANQARYEESLRKAGV